MYKIIQRDRNTNRQQKKRIYETAKSFNTYAYDLCSRYSLSYKIEIYKQVNEEWELICEFKDRDEFYNMIQYYISDSAVLEQTFLSTLEDYKLRNM